MVVHGAWCDYSDLCVELQRPALTSGFLSEGQARESGSIVARRMSARRWVFAF